MFSLSKLVAMATLLVALLLAQSATAFTAPIVPPQSALSVSSPTRLNFFGGPKDDGSPGD